MHTNYHLISFPKCGRTWLRLMIGYIFSKQYQLDYIDLLELDQFHAENSSIPLITVSHDDRSNLKTSDEILNSDKSAYKSSKVIILVRDIRDVLVSYYFEYTKRRTHFNPVLFDEFNGEISDFMRIDRGGVDSIIAFYNTWAQNLHIPADCIIIRYEDLKTDPVRELTRFCNFIQIDVSQEYLDEAVQFASFDNMRQMEVNDTLESERLQPVDSNDFESFKTRKGKVGGFVEYLSNEDIEYLNNKIKLLSPIFGYSTN